MGPHEKNTLTAHQKKNGETGERSFLAVSEKPTPPAPIFNIYINNNTGCIVIGDQVSVNSSSAIASMPIQCKQTSARRDNTAHDGDLLIVRTPEILNEVENRKRKRVEKQLQLPFRQRKKRRAPLPRHGVSRELIFQSIDKQGAHKELQVIYQAMNELHPLRESGNWIEFNNTLESFHENGNSVIIILTHIERGVAQSYQGDFDSAKNSIDRAKTMLVDLNSPVRVRSFLVALLHAHLTSFYRRQNMIEEADKAIAEAQQNLDSLSGNIVQAYMFYEKASNLTKAVSLIPISDERRIMLVQQANNYLKACIDVCSGICEEGSVYVRRHQFALVKMALQQLNCRTRAARSNEISQDSIREAKDCIWALENKFGKDINGATAIQLNVAKSDLSYRLRDFPNAKLFANQALETAKRLEFNLEIKPIQERLDDIGLIMHALSECPSLVPDRASDREMSSSFAVDIELLTENFKNLSIRTRE